MGIRNAARSSCAGRVVAAAGAVMLLLAAGTLWRAASATRAGPPAAKPDERRLAYEPSYMTYFGGSGAEILRDLTADAAGNVYVAGSTGSADLPRSPGDIGGQSDKAGGMVAKFDPAGRRLWSRVFDGEYLYTVRVGPDGGVVVAGRMRPGFPTTPGAPQPTASHPCGFVGKLKPDGSAWAWATYVGTGYAVRDMAMDDRGDVYCVLDYFEHAKERLPEPWFEHALCKTPHGGGNHFGKSDAGVIKLSNDGRVLWATWFGGGKGNDWVASVAVGPDHCPVALLRTYSADMPTTDGAYSRAPSEGWHGKLSADGSKLEFGTYIADAFPRTHNLAVDAGGNVFLCTCT
jgi:hypothetical protein